MASYHLDVKSVQRSAGRSATAAIAYRAAERIECQREGRVHDYRAKAGVEASFIVAPEDAPAWAQDRQALWNAAEARETRVNSVTAREWELALPHELTAQGRRELAHAFARELVARYGVAADVAIHAPHREGDQRNWHAHVLTTTRALGREGLAEKTRQLDAKQTRGAEVTYMRERWASLQNRALERAGHETRVDHRSLQAQREAALERGDERAADNLDRAPEVKLGPAVSAIERREQRAAEREERAYVPLTERGQLVHEARQARQLLAELARVREALREQVRERAALARGTYAHAREEGRDQVRAGLAALRAAVERQGIGQGAGHGLEPGHTDGRSLSQVLGRERSGEAEHAQGPERGLSAAGIRERLARLLGREASQHAREGPEAGRLAHEGSQEGERSRPGLEHGREAHGTGAHQTPSAEAIRERLEALQARERPGMEREDHGERAHAPDPINERLRALLARERPALEREGLSHGHGDRAYEGEREERSLKKARGLGYGL